MQLSLPHPVHLQKQRLCNFQDGTLSSVVTCSKPKLHIDHLEQYFLGSSRIKMYNEVVLLSALTSFRCQVTWPTVYWYFFSDNLNPPCSRDREELCYFCHQRNKRNIYTDVSEEKKKREQQYEKILHDYQDKKRRLTTAKEMDAKKRSQHYAKDASRYNFEVARRKVSVVCVVLYYYCHAFSESWKNYKIGWVSCKISVVNVITVRVLPTL